MRSPYGRHDLAFRTVRQAIGGLGHLENDERVAQQALFEDFHMSNAAFARLTSPARRVVTPPPSE
jgi:hypothetical protein